MSIPTFLAETCKVGQGEACCRYVTMTMDGWSCAKPTGMKEYLDHRVHQKAMRAKGDNCPGVDNLEERAKA